MLNKNDAIRVDRVYNNRHLRYIFLCNNCPNEMSIQVTYLKKHSGYCKHCSPTFRYNKEIKPFLSLYNSLKRAAKKRKHVFDLTYEQFLEFTTIEICRYCGDKIVWKEHNHGAFNLDRKDNTKGYTLSNICVCCGTCNYKKGRFFSDEEFATISDYLRLWKSLSKEERKELEYMVLSWKDQLVML